MFLNFIFSKEIDSNFVFKKYIPSLKSMWRQMCFVLSKHFAISASAEKIILKNISAKEESEEVDECHDSQKCLRQSSSKKFSKKSFHGFCMFFKFKGSILRFFLRSFFLFFFKRSYNLRDKKISPYFHIWRLHPPC